MNTGSVLAQFTITLTQAVSEPVLVDWYTSDGTAKAGVDYAANKGTATFAPGQTAKVVSILVYGRAVGSEDRSFFVEMLPPVNAILGASIGECIIHVDNTGSTPVTQIIVPSGPQGISAYQVWLDLGNTGTEQDFIDSLKPSAKEIAEEVAPLLNVGNSPVTAEGTEAFGKPDEMTVKRLARRVAYVGAAKIAKVVLADGDNLISTSDLTGDAVDFSSIGLYPRIMRGTSIISPVWNVEADGRLMIKSAVAGDLLYVCQYDLASGQAVTRLAFESLRRSYAEAGYNLRPYNESFETGGTVATVADLLLHRATGKAYSFAGPFPHTTTTQSMPGVGWTDRSGALLVDSLAGSAGSSKIGHGSDTVKAALNAFALRSGASLVGYGSGTVDDELKKLADDGAAQAIKLGELDLQIDVKSLSPRRNTVAPLWANGKKGTTILGDSICHGAFAGNLFSHGITRLLARAINAECGSSSYGFTPMTTLGIGQSYESRDIHNPNFTNVGSGWVGQGGAAGSEYLNGFAFRSTNIGNKINITLPSFQRRAAIHHANQIGGGTFTIKVNGVLAATVNTGSNTNKFSATELAANDNQYGVTIIEVETTDALPVDICGISYFSSEVEPVLQNMSDSGRRARYVSTAVVNEVCAQSSTVIFALGQNDYAETDAAYITATIAVIDALIAASNANGCRMVVPDFCWMAAGASNWMRLQLKRLAVETNGIYIPFPDLLRQPNGSQPDYNYLVNTLGMWVDGSHPNVNGCQWIFETIAKCMGLSCSSKREALTLHDYWMPLPLDSAVSVENAVPTVPSACKRTPAGIAVRLFVEAAPSGEFPVGTYTICNSFAARTDISGSSLQSAVIQKLDRSAVIGGASFSPSGQVIITINAASTFKDLAFGALIP